MTVRKIIEDLETAGAQLWLEGDRLRYRAPKGVMTSGRIEQLKDNKTEIIAHIQARMTGRVDIPDITRDPSSRFEPFELTEIQQAYLIGRSSVVDFGNIGAHVYIETRSEDIDVDVAERAWQQLIERHDMLRAVVLPSGEQKVLEDVPEWRMERLDLSQLGEDDAAIRLAELRGRMSHRVYDPEQWPLWDLQATTMPGGAVHMHISLELLIVDVWSIFLLGEQWTALVREPERVLPPLSLTFRDYIKSVAALKKTKTYERSWAYWKDRIETLPLGPDLPMRPDAATLVAPRAHRRMTQLDADAWRRLRERCASHRLTPTGLIVSIYAEALSMYSKRRRFTISCPQFNRLPLCEDVNALIGDFTSVGLLVVDNTDRLSFVERAQRIQRTLLEDYEHRAVTGVDVLRERLRREGQMPKAMFPVVFTSLFGMVDKEFSQLFPGEMVYGISQTPQVYLDCQVVEDHDELVIRLDAWDGLFPPEMVDSLFGMMSSLLQRLAREDAVWTEVSPLSIDAATVATLAGPGSMSPIVQPELLQAGLRRQIDGRPDALAVIAADQTLTFGELGRHSDAVARTLGRQPADTLVAVCMNKGWAQIVGALAVLDAGGAYLPVDPDMPAERLAAILADARVSTVLTTSDVGIDWPNGVVAICVDGVDVDGGAWHRAARGLDDLAYVIYTSGSTGSPKGAMLTHRAASNTILDVVTRFSLAAGDRVLGVSSLSFDLSVFDVFGVLGAGGAVVLPSADRARDPAHWLELMRTHDVSVWNSVPQLMELLVDEIATQPAPASLRVAMLSGDWIPVALCGRFAQTFPDAALHSLGGPTECAIWQATYPITAVDADWPSVPYGQPMANQRIYVLDEQLEPRPTWVPGELYIGGESVGRGYFGDEAATAARYIEHPTTKERLFRSGDHGRWLPDGTIEFLGREDGQVKIRGFRIELGEIETALRSHDGVVAAVVQAIGDPKGLRRLVGYVVGADGFELDEAALGTFLAEHVPEYMIPGRFMTIDRVPLTSNGKVDRAALPSPSVPQGDGATEVDSEAERSVREFLVSCIAGRMDLPPEQIDTSASLASYGIDSISALRITRDLETHLGKQVDIAALWAHDRIDDLARHLATVPARARAELPQIVPDVAAVNEPFPLNELQQAYWFGRIDSLELGGVACHVYTEVEREDIDVPRLQSAMRGLIARHPMLRAVIDDDGQQRFLPDVEPYTIIHRDLSGLSADAAQSELLTTREQMSHRVYRTDQWPLFEVRAHRLASGRVRVHLSCDLLMSDVLSFLILSNEWQALYDDPQAALPPLDLTFRDYVLAELALRDSDEYRSSLEYWRGRVVTLPPAPDLPLAKNPRAVTTPHFTRRRKVMDGATWRRLKANAAKAGVTPSVALGSAYAQILDRWSRSKRFTLNLTLFNRLPIHDHVNHLVGDFTSLVLLEVDHETPESFALRASRWQKQLWRDLEHRQVNGVKVLEEWSRFLGRTATAPIVFTCAVGLQEELQHDRSGFGGWLGEVVYSVSQTPQVWLDHQAYEHGDDVVLSWDSVDELFGAGLLDDMFAAYIGLLERLASDESAWHHPSLDLLPSRQRRLRAEANATDAPVPEGLLHSGLAEQAKLRPSAPAIVATTRTLSYLEVDRFASRTANRLVGAGAHRGAFVAIVMNKGWQQVMSTYGVLRAGCGYLPIDPSLPSERVQYLLDATEAQHVLTTPDLLDAVDWPAGVQILAVDDDPFADEDETCPPQAQEPDDLAYVIFTSGSTGRPKGVMIDHRSAKNTCVDMNERFGVKPDDRVLGLSALDFDLSVYDIFGTSLAGGALVLIDPDRRQDPSHWQAFMSEAGVTVWNSAPALMKIYLEYLRGESIGLPPALRLVLLSGDWIPLTVPGELRAMKPDVDVISLGGATEGSIWSIAYPIGDVDSAWRSVPYGKPLKNQSFHVMDEHMLDCPEWVPGQLFIGGAGVARGYIRDPEKTAAQFVLHPKTNERLYATGDLGRYLPDGNIEFLGREDTQVKLQGLRIELGEIEAVLAKHPGVREALVSVYDTPAGDRQLVSYVTRRLRVVRMPTHVSCRVANGDGVVEAAFVADLSRRGVALAGVPETWQVGRVVQVSLRLVGADWGYAGKIVWRADGLAGVRFDAAADMAMERAIEVALDARQAGASEPERINGYLQPRLRLGVTSEISIAGLTGEVVVDNVSRGGLGLDDVPASCVIGDEVRVAIRLLGFGEPVALQGKVLWRTDRRAGVGLVEPPTAWVELIDQVVGEVGHCLTPSSVPALKQHLEAFLPAAMVPKTFMLLDGLPLSKNGKVDRRALPKPNVEARTVLAPRTELEQTIADAWKDVLGLKEVGVDESFFEIGGYSQLAVRLILALREQLAVELPVRTLFETPTIEALAARVEAARGGAIVSKKADVPRGRLYAHYGRRGVGERLAAIGTDKNYVRARGQTLTYVEGGCEIDVLDMVGGYGSTIVGHNHPELVALAKSMLDDGEPVHAQYSNNVAAGQLCKALSDRLFDANGQEYVVTLASSGTEAIEAAIKHAKMEYRARASQIAREDANIAALIIDEHARQDDVTIEEGLLARMSAKWGVEIESLDALYEYCSQLNLRTVAAEPVFLGLTHAFHGMTSGALSLTASADFREPIGWMGVRARLVSQSPEDLEAAVEAERTTLFALTMDAERRVTIRERPWHRVCGLFVEPIQGEGGIRPVQPEFLEAARAKADEAGFPIVVDEIQCGMGRTGKFTAAETLGLRGDYYAFSKSLGGGLSKVSALAVREPRYQPDFGYVHGSTYAEDAPGCRVALETLKIIERDELLRACAVKGELLASKLRALKARHPTVIDDVRGAGLMLGVQIASQKDSPSLVMRVISGSDPEMFNQLIAGYLLNVWHIRIAPTKTRNTIRFLPSAYITEAEMDRVVEAFDAVCTIIERVAVGRLVKYLVEPNADPHEPVRDWRDDYPVLTDDEPAGETRVAHLGHIEDDETMLMIEPSLGEVDKAQREALLWRLFRFARPAIGQRARITTATGASVHLSIIGLLLTGEMFESMMRSDDRELLLLKIEEAVQLARKEGCKVVGFGGYTSIVTLNCTAVATPDITLTSGNAFTAALGIEGVGACAEAQGLDLATATVGIVGAKGNIGSISARILAERSPNIVLIGRDATDELFQTVAHAIFGDAWRRIMDDPDGQHAGVAKEIRHTATVQDLLRDPHSIPRDCTGGKIVMERLDAELGGQPWVVSSDDMSALRACDVIVSTTSAAQPVIYPEHLSDRAKVISDIAMPRDVAPSVRVERPDIRIISGGLAKLPNADGFSMTGTKLPAGYVYGCVAETTLLGVEGYDRNFSFGEMTKSQVDTIRALAKKHGYGLGLIES